MCNVIGTIAINLHTAVQIVLSENYDKWEKVGNFVA